MNSYKRDKTAKRKFSIFNFSVLLLSAAILTSCGSKSGETSSVSENKKTEASQIFPIEKGIIYRTSNASGFKTEEKIYFDQWGKRQATEMQMDMGVVKVHNLRIERDDEVWDINMTEKIGTHYKKRMPVNPLGMDLEKEITAEMKKAAQIHSISNTTFLGFQCKKVVMGDPKMEYIMYGNILMKASGKMMGMEYSVEVSKIDKSAPPADIFNVPNGIKIQEILVN
jgi:hypothetical protein